MMKLLGTGNDAPGPANPAAVQYHQGKYHGGGINASAGTRDPAKVLGASTQRSPTTFETRLPLDAQGKHEAARS